VSKWETRGTKNICKKSAWLEQVRVWMMKRMALQLIFKIWLNGENDRLFAYYLRFCLAEYYHKW